MGTTKTFHEILKDKIDAYCHLAYKVSRNFPREELYGITSQFRKAVISVALNYTEGYARMRSNVHKNFMSEAEHLELKNLAEEISRMLWGMLKKIA